MTLLFVVVGIGIVAGVAILFVRDRPLIDDDPAPVRRDWPPPEGVGPEALAEARFTVALRGYRMDEVDRVLADAGEALEERDRRIAELEDEMRTVLPVAPATGREAAGGPAQPGAGGDQVAGEPAVTGASAEPVDRPGEEPAPVAGEVPSEGDRLPGEVPTAGDLPVASGDPRGDG